MGRTASALAICLAAADAAPAASGVSDIAATRAVWVRGPFALVKCFSDGGRYPARLVKARPATADESSFWQLFPPHTDGIVPLETVADGFQVAAQVGDRFVARYAGGRCVVVDLGRPDDPPVEVASDDELACFLGGEGIDLGGPVRFGPADDLFRRADPPATFGASACLSLTLAGAALTAALALRFRRPAVRRL